MASQGSQTSTDAPKKPKLTEGSISLDKAQEKGKQEVLDNIKRCQAELDRLNTKASEEILQMEQSYSDKRRPFFDQRQTHMSVLPHFWITAVSFRVASTVEKTSVKPRAVQCANAMYCSVCS